MSHPVSNRPWGTVDLNVVTGDVLVREDWRCRWLLWPGTRSLWTYPERRATHARIDRAVWAIWRHRLSIAVKPKSGSPSPPFGCSARVSFDVPWTLHRGHWTVTVWKMPRGSAPTALHRSFVDPAWHTIGLDTADLTPRVAANAAGASTLDFVTPPHEFGHTMDNPDEYNAGSPFLHDSASLINIGREVRRRHLHLLLDVLARMAPQWTFSL